MSACHCALEKPAVREPAHDACDKSRQCCHLKSCVNSNVPYASNSEVFALHPNRQPQTRCSRRSPPHGYDLLRVPVLLRFHIRAQHCVHASQVTFAASTKKLKHIGINPKVHRLLRLTFNNLSIVPKTLWHIQGLRVFVRRRNFASVMHCPEFFKGSSFCIFHSPSDFPSKRR